MGTAEGGGAGGAGVLLGIAVVSQAWSRRPGEKSPGPGVTGTAGLGAAGPMAVPWPPPVAGCW